MAIDRLLIHSFRNIHSIDQKLAPRFNYIMGDNGSGKTSFLESIYYLGHGRSFRTALTKRIINNETMQFQLYAEAAHHHLGIQKNHQGETIVKVDHLSNQRLTTLAKHLPIQLIHPDGFELLTAGPKMRRQFIDWGVFHHQSQFHQTWFRLQRLFKQRHVALKQAFDYQQIRPWDRELVQLAEQIDQWRSAYIDEVSEKIRLLCHLFLPEHEITLNYYRGWERETDYADILEKNFERDKQLGYTGAGPNRADLRLKSHQTPVDDHLSRGQLKLLLCALRLAQGLFYSEHSTTQCIYLIDDFSAELDQYKREILFNALKEMNAQVFITSISSASLMPFLKESFDPLKDKVFHISSGKLSLSEIISSLGSE